MFLLDTASSVKLSPFEGEATHVTFDLKGEGREVTYVRKQNADFKTEFGNTPPTLTGAGPPANGEYQQGLQPVSLTG